MLVAGSGGTGFVRAPAKDIYPSRIFRLSRQWAERHGTAWFILSSKYGVLAPSKVVAPYNNTLRSMTPVEREAWSFRVLEVLHRFRGQRITVLAADPYCAWCRHFPDVEQPFKGMRINQHLAWLETHL